MNRVVFLISISLLLFKAGIYAHTGVDNTTGFTNDTTEIAQWQQKIKVGNNTTVYNVPVYKIVKNTNTDLINDDTEDEIEHIHTFKKHRTDVVNSTSFIFHPFTNDNQTELVRGITTIKPVSWNYLRICVLRI